LDFVKTVFLKFIFADFVKKLVFGYVWTKWTLVQTCGKEQLLNIQYTLPTRAAAAMLTNLCLCKAAW